MEPLKEKVKFGIEKNRQSLCFYKPLPSTLERTQKVIKSVYGISHQMSKMLYVAKNTANSICINKMQRLNEKRYGK